MDNWNGKQKLIAKIVCVLLSIVLWFYVTNIENPVRTYDMNKVPVELLNEEALQSAGLALAPNQQFYVNLKLEGQSQDIFKVDRSDFKVTVDLSELAFKVGENKVLVNIAEAPNNITVKNSNGLTVTLNIEAYTSKELPVKSKIEVVSKSSYYVSTPVFAPNTITVSGPESLVNRAEKVIAEGQENNAVETIVKNYMISVVDENDDIIDGVELSQNWVEATISINEGKTVPVKINTEGNLAAGLKMKSIDSKIKEIGITGPQEVLDGITEINTEIIDLSQVTESTTIDVALGIPDDVLIQNGEYSIAVDIVLEKKQTKEFNIPYSLIGVANGFEVTQVSNTVTITVSDYEDKLNLITADNFKAELDVAQYVEEGTFSKTPTVTLVNEDSDISIDNIGEVEIKVTKLQPEVSEDNTITEEEQP